MNAIPLLLFWFVLPLWLIAGVADYFCHRRTHLECTSGLGEAALHVVQALQIAIGLFAGLFLEINPLVLAALTMCVLVHMATSLWDTAYTNDRRRISPLEQHIHSHLEYLPLIAVMLTALLYWDGLPAALAPAGRASAFSLQWKLQPIPTKYIVPTISVFVFQSGLLAEEFARALRAARAPDT